MSTVIEDRLTTALRARAELVQPEDLRHLALPQPESLRWRRPAVIALVAAAVAAVVVPLVLKGNHSPDHHPLPSDHFPMPTPTPTKTLSGDVDGDGRPDRVRVSGHTLTVTLAADPAHPLTQSIKHLVGLAGLAHVGTPGLGILSVQSNGPGVIWGITGLRNGKLGVLSQNFGEPTVGHPQGTDLSVVPGNAFSWITPTGVPMSGLLDPMQRGQQKLAVRVTRFAPKHGDLAASATVDWCWDVVTQKVPAPCPAGVTDVFDPGPHASLPALLPKFSSTGFRMAGDVWQDGATSLTLVKGPVHTRSILKQVYDVKGTIDGREVSAPAGYGLPRLLTTFVDLGHGVRGLAVIDDSKATWNLLAVAGGGLEPLVAEDPSNGARGTSYLHPGTHAVFVDGKPRTADTWIGPDGVVFTRVETDRVGHFQLYEWQVADSPATKLEPVDLGTVCIDDFQATYGTCPTTGK
jgi:hypothetical protein